MNKSLSTLLALSLVFAVSTSSLRAECGDCPSCKKHEKKDNAEGDKKDEKKDDKK